jgi:FAD/FMN-containing dehydrogenase
MARIGALIGASVMTIAGTPAAFASAVGERLAAIRGRVIHRGDGNYIHWWASMVWYVFKPNRHPDIIVQAVSDEDVVNAVLHARETGMKVAVRATGHNPARGCLRQGGVLISLSDMREVTIDAQAETAWIEPGIHSEKLIEKTRKAGFAFPAAHTGIVGMGGYLIGGGLGWNMPEWDIACRSILAAEIVLADGRKVIASETENTDLLWAVRGAGPGFFGIVLRYKLKLYPLHTHITKSKYLLPLDKLPEICAALEDLVKAKETRLEVLAVIGRFYPPSKPPEERDLVCAVSLVAFADSDGDAARLLAPVADMPFGALALLKKENARLSYPELYAGQETDFSSPNRTAVENVWTDDPSTVLQKLAARLHEIPTASPRSFALSAWAFNGERNDPTSCVQTAADHYVSWYLMAEREADIEPNRIWMDESVAELRPHAKGHYINEIDPLRYPQHVAECFAPEDWKRLVDLRRLYDPDGVFHSYLGHDA